MKKKIAPHASRKTAIGLNELLDSVLAQVPFDGWTEAAFAAGAKQAGLSRGEADLLCPQGIRDLVEAFGARADAAMQERIDDAIGFRRFKTRDKIAFAVRARLESLTPQREALKRLLVWYALPQHLPLAARRVYKTVDLIWRAAGDTSTDFNFYTKRLLLAGVLKATLLFWLTDDSQNAEASWQFLDRRIGEVLKLGKGIGLLKEFRAEEIVGFLKQKLRRA